MNTSIIFLLLIQIVLIFLNAVFASAEIAVLSFNELKLAKLVSDGDKRARRLSRLTCNPARFLATIQVAITLAGFMGSAFAAENFSDSLTEWFISLGVPASRSSLNTFSVILITLILSYFTLIFGELVPKRVAMKKSEQLSLGLSGLISGLSTIFTPLVWLLTISTNGVLKIIGIDPEETTEDVSEEEIRMMVDAGSEKGAIDHEEKEFIQNVFEFNDLMVSEIATHRKDTVFLCMEDSDEDLYTTIYNSRHSLFPVYTESRDHVIGILNAKDYFRLEDRSRSSVLKNAVRNAYFVPDSIKADVLFRNMKRDKVSLAVVIDEYGGMFGIITQNDLIEQLVGKLGDEDDLHELHTDPYLEPVDDTTWIIHGNVTLREIAELTDQEINFDQFDTLTGLIFDHLGSIPLDGSQDLSLTVNRLCITITYIRRHQIEQGTIKLLKSTSPETISQ